MEQLHTDAVWASVGACVFWAAAPQRHRSIGTGCSWRSLTREAEDSNCFGNLYSVRQCHAQDQLSPDTCKLYDDDIAMLNSGMID